MSLITRAGRTLARLPLVQAPMAGVSTPALAAAVSGAGALGSIALGALSPAAAEETMAATRMLTQAPVAWNVFCHAPAIRDATREAAWLSALEPAFARLGTTPPAHLRMPYASFVENDALLEVLLAGRAEVVSFHFGLPRPDQIDRLKALGTTLFACATTVTEALACADAGMDFIVLQGIEAGGHRGCFDPLDPNPLALHALLEAVRAAVDVPLIATGGLMSGGDVARVLRAGAVGAQLGTAFIPCMESSAAPEHRTAVVDGGTPTEIMTAVSGRPARGFVKDWASLPSDAVPDYPVAYDAGKALAAAARAAGKMHFDVHWAGSGVGRGRALPAAALVAQLARELSDQGAP